MVYSHGSYVMEYHLWMVILSVVIGIFTSYVALQLINRNIKSTQKDRFWLTTASLVMGGGVWAVHFIGMLAIHIKVNVSYNIWLVIISFILIVVFSMLAFTYMVNGQKRRKVVISSLLMGIGIFCMHYLSMRSMKMEANLTYVTVLLLLSLLAAILGSGVTFWLFSKYQNEPWFGAVGSITLGCGIAGMHYIGMSATTFEKQEFQHPDGTGGYVLSGYTIAIAISIFLLVLFVLLLFLASRDQRLRFRLKVSEEHYKRLVELAPVGIVVHKFGVVHYINPTGIKILGAKISGEIVGRHFLNFIHLDYHDVIKDRWNIIRKDSKPVGTIEEKMLRVDKRTIHAEVSASPYEMDGETYVQVFFTDITARKEAEQIMYQLAFNDALSGLPNRRYFSQELNKAIKQSEITGRFLSVLFLDLDGFKAINDTYGHEAGDILIQKISSRLKDCMPEKGVLSRIGGDEFNIFLPDSTYGETKQLAEKIIQTIQVAVIIQDVSVFVTSSVGIAFFPKDGLTSVLLMKHADEAMFQAKRQGKNKFHFYAGENEP